MKTMNSLITEQRKKYHSNLLSNGVLSVDDNGIPSNADKASKLSVSIARGIAKQLAAQNKVKAVGQTAGAQFEQLSMEFLENTFPLLQISVPVHGISPNSVTAIQLKPAVLPNMNILNTLLN